MIEHEIEYFLDKKTIDYPDSIEFMEKKIEDIHKNNCKEFLWFLEHDNIYTAGTSAKKKDLINSNKFKVYKSSRGGQYTYHGPGQRVVYLMLNLRKKGYDIRKFISLIEEWIIKSLKDIDVNAVNDKNHVGIWIKDKKSLKKISSIGLRVRKGITFHGISINLNPNLENFKGINPCGNDPKDVTSLEEIGLKNKIKKFDQVLLKNFSTVFNVKLKSKKTLK
ncbi:MAG: lipoyl(octanoyl) transferase LipB [Pseudomonadota bacterium]|jgi:lipoyl(octanoyl) transferase|nr:lipoyl(octanoyl) transferase LipB [Pseudomonadota bacterium]|tara:strand:- start:598 stop:1260 length:663 start_codon:yes stop_codon:yes gene_type:complete